MTHIFYQTPQALLQSIGAHIAPCVSALDVGCGIRPQNLVEPDIHIMLEPFDEYVEILRYKYDGNPRCIVLQGDFGTLMPHFSDKSIDSVFLLDLIEHLEKEDGFRLLAEAERVAKRQVVVFTPLGFMPQHYEAGELDGWGLGGATFQEHRSGWTPEDFDGSWSFHICDRFHGVDSKARRLDEPFGAFYGLLNMSPAPVPRPSRLSAIDELNRTATPKPKLAGGLWRRLRRSIAKLFS